MNLLAGDLCLIVGTPEMDPVSPGTRVTYIGPIVWQRGNGELPPWAASLNCSKPVVWVYTGNPKYAGAAGSTACDSIVVIRTAIAALADAPVHVVLTTGYHDVPAEIGVLPANFPHAAFLPGRAMVEPSDLIVHHGGHSSVMQSLAAGTPAVIIPTITERESNARRPRRTRTRDAHRDRGWRKADRRPHIRRRGAARFSRSRLRVPRRCAPTAEHRKPPTASSS